MSRKMLGRGRYPRDASLYANPGSGTQVSQPVVSTAVNYTQPSDMPLYNTQSMQQFQGHQNSWQTTPTSLYSSPQQSQVHNSWPSEPQYSQTGSTESSVWNWTPENSRPSHSIQPIHHNQQQQQQQQQHQQQQQFNHSEVPNTLNQFTSNTTSQSYYSPQTVPLMQTTNMNFNNQNNWYAGITEDSKKFNGNKPDEQTLQPMWQGNKPVEHSLQPMWEGNKPAEQTLQPTWEGNKPVEQPLQPVWDNKSAEHPLQPTWEDKKPAEQTHQPMWGDKKPAEQSLQPTWGGKPAEQPLQSTWEGNKTAEQTHQPMWGETKPAEQSLQPTWGGNKPAEQHLQPTWETMSTNISQAEHLPWTYSVPQNVVTAADNSCLWSNSSFSQNAVSYSNVSQNWGDNSNNSWQEAGNVGEYKQNQVSQASASEQNCMVQDSAFVPYQVVPSQQNNNNDANPMNSVENLESCVPGHQDSGFQMIDKVNEVADSENSGLNAFFHHSIEENVEAGQENLPPCVMDLGSHVASTNDENVAALPLAEQENPLYSVSQLQDDNTESGSSVGNSGAQDDCESFVLVSASEGMPTLPAEEPLNQEVPEPYSAFSASTTQQVKQDNVSHENSPDEPLNQQIPVQTAASVCAVERNGATLEENSPFKQPVKPNAAGPIGQQDNSFLAKPATQGGFQEVNLETVPDNLERPPDYDDLRKESALSASFRQHLRSMEEEDSILDTSKASLWEDPKLPCVLLAPAAPLRPKTPSAMSVNLPLAAEPKPAVTVTAITSSLQDLHIKASSPLLPKEDKPPSSAPSPAMTPKQTSPSPSPKHASPAPVTETSNTARVSAHNAEISKGDSSSVKEQPEKSVKAKHSKTSYESLRSDRGQSKSPAIRQASPIKEQRQAVSSMDMTHNDNYPPSHSDVERERHSRSYTDMRGRPPPDFEYDQHSSRYDHRSSDRHPDRRFVDNRYSSFDERQSFNREGSRPSSRMSLDESIESRVSRDHNYRNNYAPDYDRPSSRMSESEAYRAAQGDRYYNDPRYSTHGNYSNRDDFYRMRGYPGYGYNQYSASRPYYGYYDPYQYPAAAYSNFNYGFYDELYRNDPRYKKQWDDYYKQIGYDTDYERSSAYSGRSSANELSNNVSQRYPENDASSSDIQYPNYEQESQLSSYEASEVGKEPTPVSRLTPVKFTSPHAFLNFTPSGQLLKCVPAKSMSGVPPLLEIHSIQALCQNDPAYKEMKQFQGPLVRRETHKNDIIDFCLKKVKYYKQKQGIHDRESYILLWELLILLLRQNGSVAGSDIAELLLKDHEVLRPPLLRHTSDIPQGDSSPADACEVPAAAVPSGDASSPDEGIVVTRDKTILNSSQCFDIDKVTRKFREFLLFGHKKDALEWAMKHNLWGHALFLASKMDVRTYANVMTRFANSLALNDPLQTLYQLMSGRQPAAVTCVADKQWGDWRPHLAMILSNPSSHSEVDFKSITTLGDTLAAQGCLPATQFCYLMAQVEFGSFSCKSSKMVLLLGDHQLPFSKFATNEAIQCTEIYEYAQSLANPGFILNHLQAYKFIYATRLADNGFLQEALHYCEVLAANFLSNPSGFPAELIKEVYELALRLKYYDPHYLQGQGELEEQEDPEWLKTLASLLSQAQRSQSFGQEVFDQQPETGSSADAYQNKPAAEAVQEMPSAEVHNGSYPVQENPVTYSNAWITGNILQPQQQQYSELSPYESQFSPQGSAAQGQPNFTPQWNMSAQKTQEMYYDNKATASFDESQSSPHQTSPSQKFNFYGSSEPQMPMHSIHSKERTSSTSSIGLGRDRRDSALSSGSDYGTSKNSAEVQKAEDKSEKSRPQVGRSWLGGIFSKLLPKAPNQMILPDDKNPTIVWDPVKNRWVNTDSKEDDVAAQPSAPPRDSELLSKIPESSNIPAMPPVAAASSPLTNKFQRPKVKGMRQNYVDILNPISSSTETPPSSDNLFPTMPTPLVSANMLVPAAPVSDDPPIDFVTTQSYSYGATQGNEESVPQAPPMFDPAEFDSRRASMSTVRHGIGSGHRTYPT